MIYRSSILADFYPMAQMSGCSNYIEIGELSFVASVIPFYYKHDTDVT